MEFKIFNNGEISDGRLWSFSDSKKRKKDAY